MPVTLVLSVVGFIVVRLLFRTTRPTHLVVRLTCTSISLSFYQYSPIVLWVLLSGYTMSLYGLYYLSVQRVYGRYYCYIARLFRGDKLGGMFVSLVRVECIGTAFV